MWRFPEIEHVKTAFFVVNKYSEIPASLERLVGEVLAHLQEI
jgi:hypothetical protein